MRVTLGTDSLRRVPGLLDYIVSPSPIPFPLDFGFRIWDLDLGLGFGPGLGLDNIYLFAIVLLS